MSSANIVALGVLAGITIFIGLPIGRLTKASTGLRATLNSITIGILLFLLWDVLTHALEPLEGALTSASAGEAGQWGAFAGFAVIFFGAVAVGLLSLVFYDEWMTRRARARTVTAALVPETLPATVPTTIHATVPAGSLGSSIRPEISPTTALPTSLGPDRSGPLRLSEPASRLAFLIAVGIGLHNFSEGLAIGQSAASGQISLAVILVVGFGLHNATEGFGITAPLAGAARKPSWLQLIILGIIGGGPTFVGTILGQVFVNDYVSTAFLALAAGSIIYVIVQLLGVARKFGTPMHLYTGLLAGLFAGFATDFVIAAAGV